MPVCCECCVLSGRGLCDELLIRPGESYRQWCVAECDLKKQSDSRQQPPKLMTGRSNGAVVLCHKVTCLVDFEAIPQPLSCGDQSY